MSEPQYAVVLVDSTSHALRVENVLTEGGLTSKMIPVPRHLSSDCGACVRIELHDVGRVQSQLEAAGVVFVSIEPI